MHITVRLPDELGKEVKSRTDNVSAYVAEALSEKIQREKRYEARKRLLRFAGTGVDPDLYDTLQQERRASDRDVSK